MLDWTDPLPREAIQDKRGSFESALPATGVAGRGGLLIPSFPLLILLLTVNTVLTACWEGILVPQNHSFSFHLGFLLHLYGLAKNPR